MKTLLTTLLAIAAILMIWARIGSNPVSPEIPLPAPRSAPLPEPAPVTVAIPAATNRLPQNVSTQAAPAPPAPVNQPLTAAQRALKARLEKQISAEIPTHKMTFDKVKTLTGWLVSENSNLVTFSESYGNKGSMSVNISRRRIVSIAVLTNKTPVITDRDVRFQQEFPRFNFFKRHPYTILTDESFFQVERIVRDLQKTYGQFSSRFQPLIRRDRNSAGDVQVLVFSSQEGFRRYAFDHFHQTNEVAGFYNIESDRLAVYNQTTSDWINNAIKQEEAEAISRYGDSPELRQQLNDRRGSRQTDLTYFAKQFTLETVRHEGAHQLSYTLGVLKVYPRDMAWLVEGLALYSETETIGAINYWRLEELKRRYPDGAYPGIDEVISASYKLDYLNSYSAYWALTQFLMNSAHQQDFFRLILQLNDTEQWKRVPAPSDMELLCQALGTDADTLDREWRSFLQRL